MKDLLLLKNLTIVFILICSTSGKIEEKKKTCQIKTQMFVCCRCEKRLAQIKYAHSQ